MADLAAALAPELYDGFRVEIAGCPLDCRYGAARADLALVLDARCAWFVIWLGGRHRPFLPPVAPKAWFRRELSDVRGLLELVFKIHDLWGRLAMDAETLPELAVRAGLERLERLLADPPAAKAAGSSGDASADALAADSSGAGPASGGTPPTGSPPASSSDSPEGGGS